MTARPLAHPNNLQDFQQKHQELTRNALESRGGFSSLTDIRSYGDSIASIALGVCTCKRMERVRINWEKKIFELELSTLNVSFIIFLVLNILRINIYELFIHWIIIFGVSTESMLMQGTQRQILQTLPLKKWSAWRDRQKSKYGINALIEVW